MAMYKTQATREASRLSALATRYAALARQPQPKDPPDLRANLAAMDRRLRLAVASLNAAAAAFPDAALPAAPPPRIQVPPVQPRLPNGTGALELRVPLMPQQPSNDTWVAPPRLAELTQPPLPNRMGLPEPRVQIASNDPRADALIRQTTFHRRVWGHVAEALRALDGRTGVRLAAAAAHYEHAKARLDEANAVLRRLSFSAWSRNEVLDEPPDPDDRLGNFEIEDLMAHYNESETLASSVRAKMDATAAAIIQSVD